MEISLDEAVELIKNKIEAQEKKFIKYSMLTLICRS